MTDQANSNGAASEGDLKEILQAHASMVSMFLAEYAPNVSVEQVAQIAAQTWQEQEEIVRKILPTLLRSSPDSTERPTVGVRIKAPSGVHGIIVAPKQIEGLNDPGLAIHWAFITALLHVPAVRAVLMAHGYEYNFVQTKQELVPENKPRIITS